MREGSSRRCAQASDAGCIHVGGRPSRGNHSSPLPEQRSPSAVNVAHCWTVANIGAQDEETVPGIQHPGSTGVIYCSDRAMANGFNYASSHEWSNLGQGAPEAGPIPGAPARPTTIEVTIDSLEYAPTTGVKSAYQPYGGFCSWFGFGWHDADVPGSA